MEEVKQEFGIQNCLEIVVASEIVLSNGVAALKDGLQVSDVQYALNIAKDLDKIVVAVKDYHLVDEELKDLSEQELVQLGLATYGMIKSVIKASK